VTAARSFDIVIGPVNLFCPMSPGCPPLHRFVHSVAALAMLEFHFISSILAAPSRARKALWRSTAADTSSSVSTARMPDDAVGQNVHREKC